jgi:3-deoxy-manno-octulosonate cytidylyltransferase (CMP-KDO synthetase)
VAEEVNGFGGQVVMTAPECRNGTERCADAVARLGPIADVIVNLQGDAPLSPHLLVQRLVDRLSEDLDASMATPVVRCTPSTYQHLVADASAGRVGGTTAVFDRGNRALYFSKRIIPYIPETLAESQMPVHLHLGLYAYRPPALELYSAAEPTELEQVEGLEQLRFLELGLPVSVVAFDQIGWDSIELNNPSDAPLIERVLAQRGID